MSENETPDNQASGDGDALSSDWLDGPGQPPPVDEPGTPLPPPPGGPGVLPPSPDGDEDFDSVLDHLDDRRTWYTEGWILVVTVAVALTVALFVVFDGGAEPPQQGDAAPSTSDSVEQVPIETPVPTPEPELTQRPTVQESEPVPTVESTRAAETQPEPDPTQNEPGSTSFESFGYSGNGNAIIDFSVPGGYPATVTFQHDGVGTFRVWDYDTFGGQLDLLVDTVGNYTGTHLVNIVQGQTVSELDITADGSWTVVVTSTVDLQPVSGSFSGSGDSVVRLSEDWIPSTRATLSHTGEGEFSIWTYGIERELIVNNNDDYTGTVLLNGGGVLWDITAPGDWAVILG